MKDAPAFDFYPERWTHGTRLMTKTERSDYLDLLCHQWTDDGLPCDLEMVARLLGYKKAKQIPPVLLEKFPLSEDGKRRNQRLEEERRKQRERIERRRHGADLTNAKRWKKGTLSESLSDRSATIERFARESPPPTTHHPPLKEIDTPCTEAEAWQFAKGLHQLPPWTEQAVTKWFSTRASSHWTKGGVNQFPITKATWKEDLRSSHSWATQQTNAHNQKYSTGRSAVRNSSSLPAGLPSLNDTAENSRVS